MKKILVLIMVAVSLFVAALAEAAAPSLVDEAKILSPLQQKKVLSALQQVEKKYGIRCAVVIKKSIGSEIPGKYANKLIDTVYNDGANGNMVLLQVTGKRKWYISTDKKLKKAVVGTNGVEYMSKAFVPLLSKNRYTDAFITYAKKADELMAFYQENGYGWTPGEEFSPEALGFGGLIALVFSWKRRKSLVSSMDNVTAAVAADTYLDRSSFEMIGQSDEFVDRIVTVTPRAKSRDNGSDGSVSDDYSDDDHGGGGGEY